MGIIKRYTPHILWLEIFKSQLGSEGKIDLFIDGNHGQQSNTTIYGIYKMVSIQEKFGLDVIASCRSLNSCIYTQDKR